MNRTDEWYDVERVTDSSYRIMEVEKYGQYLVTGTERALVIDAGVGIGDLRGLVTELVDAPVTLLLTHWHWDHIGNAAQFDDVRIHEDERTADGRVAIDGLSTEFVDRPAELVEEWQAAGKPLPDGFRPETYAIDPVEDVTPISPGESIDLGDRSLESVHTPGHSPGHLSMLDREKEVLYGGDVIHIDGGLYLHLERCDPRACLETFERLIDLRDDGAFDTLLTCHNRPLAGSELTVFETLRDGLQQILDGEADFELVTTDYGRAHRYEVEGSPVFVDPAAV